jgi:DNA segregation ATPase FtsK/SpoIIIE, S-DNA-T family
MSRNAGKSGASGARDDSSLWRSVAWIVLLGAWAFVTTSFVGFDPGDPPTHVVYPANDPAQNWCGPAGAMIAYWLVKTLGMGAWVPIAGVGGWLAMSVLGVRVTHPSVRLVGLVMLAAVAGAFQALVASGTGPFPGLAGGLVGSEVVAQLVSRFSGFGSFLWLCLAAVIAGVVAFDQWLIDVPVYLWGKTAPAAKVAGGVAVTAGGATAGTLAKSAREGLLSRLVALLWQGRRIRIRLTDLDDAPAAARVKATVEAKPRRKRIAKTAAAVGLEAVEEEELEEASVADLDEEGEEAVVEAEEEEEDDVPGAPQVFDREALREKISKLPIAFSKDTRKVATPEDLRDLQNVTELEGYRFPGLDLLVDPEENFSEKLEGLVRDQAAALEAALKQYRIDGSVVGIESGPVITLYDVALAPGTKVAQLTAVASDIARALKAVNIRIVANQAGRDTVGVEVPNPTKERVRLKELMSKSEITSKMKLPMFLGKDASGEPLISDLTTMPHMLIAGTTGSGKSVCMNTIIMSFLYTKKPNELRLVLVDPKMVEMSQFKDIPHLMCPVVTEMTKAAAILEWAMKKMDERYELLAEAGCRDIAGYNAMPWEELREAFNPQSPEEEARIPRKLPYMVFIIDELADLMMTAREVENSIIRIAQKARAVGIHLILATQRPQANVVTGLIKSNMPCRITFKVASGMDSRIVLDQKGGELLLGQGDMLYLSPQSHKLIRAQGTLVDDHEIRKVVRFMRDVAKPTFERQLVQLRSAAAGSDEEKVLESANNSSASLAAAQEDPMFFRAVEIVLETKRGSVSLLQRRLAIGYTRASRLIDLMGISGIISDHKGSVARDVMITEAEWAAMREQAEADMAAGRLPGQEGQGALFAGQAAGTASEQDAEPAAEMDTDAEEVDEAGEEEDAEEGEEDEYEEEDSDDDAEPVDEADDEETDDDEAYVDGEDDDASVGKGSSRR